MRQPWPSWSLAAVAHRRGYLATGNQGRRTNPAASTGLGEREFVGIVDREGAELGDLERQVLARRQPRVWCATQELRAP